MIVVGPPWLRTGTGRVIEDQIAYYHSRGYATAFVAVPLNTTHVPGDPMWAEFVESAKELPADLACFSFLDPVPRPNTLWRRVRQKWRRATALDWIVEVAACSTPPARLVAFAREYPVSLIHINHVFTLGFAQRLRARLGEQGRRIPAVVETHDVQADILHQRQECNPWTGTPDSLASLQRAELALFRDYQVLVHCSVDDCNYFNGHLSRKTHIIARPTIDPQFIAAVCDRPAERSTPIDVLFVGTRYVANERAVEWLLNEVWPIVADRGWHLKIVGGVDDMVRQSLPALFEEYRSCFTGYVADLAPYYRKARCVVAPMRSGGGISIKTIEAFALGIPFVGTTLAYRGFPPESLLGIRAFDDPRDFAAALARAIAGEDDSAARGRAVYETLFSKEACYAARDEATRQALLVE